MDSIRSQTLQLRLSQRGIVPTLQRMAVAQVLPARPAVVQVDAAAAAEAVVRKLRQQMVGLFDDLCMAACGQRRVDEPRVDDLRGHRHPCP